MLMLVLWVISVDICSLSLSALASRSARGFPGGVSLGSMAVIQRSKAWTTLLSAFILILIIISGTYVRE